MRVVFAGSFDPPTNGHMDIIIRAAGMFDHVFVVLARNIFKDQFFSVDVRVELLKALIRELGLDNVTVETWDGLVSDYAREHQCKALLRSVRSMVEIPGEHNMATMNERLKTSLETILMFSRPELSDISSSAVREVISWGRLPAGIVPDLVRKELEKRYGPLLQ